MGVALFCVLYLSPPFPDAVDPQGQRFQLTHEGKAALALFLLAATWWVFEVIPIGVTGIAIGVIQVLFLIRPKPEVVFGNFMDPSVWFIIGSITFGMVFSKTGLTKRMAYRMLVLVGERTSMIYLGCFVITAGLTLIMAHTAVAATIYPLLDGDLRPLHRRRKADEIRQGAVHRHGLRRGGGQYHHLAGRGPRRRGHRILQRHRRPRNHLLRTHLLHVPRRLSPW